MVAVETSAFFRVVRVRLDRGGDDVKPGMAVVASAGIVGRVQRVFGHWCDVLLAADPKSSIDVVVARTGGRGVLKGIAGGDRYRTRVEYLERKDEAAEGDLVVTSGLGGFFPRDLARRQDRARSTSAASASTRRSRCSRSVDFGKLRDVLVVVPREAQPAGPTPEAIAPPGVPENGEMSAQRAIVMVLAVWRAG